MKFRSILRDNYALSSHVLDTALLLGVAIIAFGLVSSNFLPIILPTHPQNVDLSAYIRGDYVFIEHMGGESLKYNKTRIIVSIGDEAMDKPPLIEKNNNGLWECGEYVCYFYNTTDMVSILIIDEETNSILLQGNLKRGEVSWIGAIPPILISSLRTNSDDEDLICYALPQENFNAKTYIYNWKKNGESIFEVLLPFDSQSNSLAKDYSGNGYNGIIDGATWIANGKVGGAYSFDGIDDKIEISLPDIFRDSSNDFTISLWIRSRDIVTNSTKVKTIVEIYMDEDNSLQIFQYSSSFQLGFKVNGNKKQALKTPELQENQWYFLTIVWNSGNPLIYLNGTMNMSPGIREYPEGNRSSLVIGQLSNGNNSFNGIIDEFYIYRYARSPQQVYQDYLDTKDGLSDHRTLVASETSLGDAWSCTITPNNSLTDGDSIDSETIIIQAYGGGT
ncbi:MAG TPA: hypothetical protein ENI14_01255 [Thermoplasmatales archaeon]|nr:hypothetical protein [Thermoplasmatales archaeon]